MLFKRVRARAQLIGVLEAGSNDCMLIAFPPASSATSTFISLLAMLLPPECANDSTTHRACAGKDDVTYDGTARSTKKATSLFIGSGIFFGMLVFVFAAMFVF